MGGRWKAANGGGGLKAAKGGEGEACLVRDGVHVRFVRTQHLLCLLEFCRKHNVLVIYLHVRVPYGFRI